MFKKKLIIIATGLLLTAGLTACGDDEKASGSKNTENDQTGPKELTLTEALDEYDTWYKVEESDDDDNLEIGYQTSVGTVYDIIDDTKLNAYDDDQGLIIDDLDGQDEDELKEELKNKVRDTYKHESTAYTIKMKPDPTGNSIEKEEIEVEGGIRGTTAPSVRDITDQSFNKEIYDQKYAGFYLDRRPDATTAFITKVEDDVKMKRDDVDTKGENIEIIKDD